MYCSEKLKGSVIKKKEFGNSSKLRINTILVVNNAPQREMQSNIAKTLKKTLGEDNITIYTTTTTQPAWRIDIVDGAISMNMVVYMEWLHQSTCILGNHIDFIPHKGSKDGMDPNKTVIQLAQIPKDKQ